MSQEKDIKKSLNDYIDNKFFYRGNSDSLQEEKNEELKKMVSHEIYTSVKETRPYPNVISDIDILEQEVNIVEVQGNRAYAELKIIRRIYPKDRENSSTVTQVVEEPIELNKQSEGWIIIDFNTDTLALDRNDNVDDESEDSEDTSMYTNGELISEYIRNNIVKLSNIHYKHQGAPDENPLENKEKDYELDMINLYFWILEELGVYHDFDYPVTKYDFESSDTFIIVRPKGHKYESDLFDLSEGDILFFGSNSSLIGVYLGDAQFITLTGKFPGDNSTPKVHTLNEEWWNQYNGLVYRLREDYDGQ